MLPNSFALLKSKDVVSGDFYWIDQLNIDMYDVLNTRYSVEKLDDGMDLTLCVLDLKEYTLTFSGVRNSVYIVREGELLLESSKKEISHQREHFEKTLVSWMNNRDQLDDILIMGVRV